MQQVKVPKEVMELIYEAQACESLAAHYGDSWFPSLKAVYYGAKAVKATRLAWRALRAVQPEVRQGEWTIDSVTGVATREAGEEEKAKKPRKPRAPKAEAKTETKTEGEKQ